MRASAIGVLGVVAAVGAAAGLGVAIQSDLFAGSAVAAPAPAACAFPTAPSKTPEETAWRLFVAANCPANAGKVVWENWIEQADLYPAGGGPAMMARRPGGRLHGSPLAIALAHHGQGQLALTPATQCNAMRGPPKNVVATQICEEVHINPAAASDITKAGYQRRPAQAAAAQKGVDMQFTKPGIEVKVDWIPASDFNPAFSCTKPPAGVRTEMFGGVCYAMAGMHISSKLLKDWVWATFEPQSMLTNPLRCITFGPCHDGWGSVPAVSNGGTAGFTKQTLPVQQLMQQAKLAPAYSNYRLDGVQITFTTPDKKPTYLGNSVIEGENVGMTRNTASCITCHSVSTVKTDGTDGASFLGSASTVGAAFKPPAGWIARDFVWSLGLACPNAAFQTCAPAAKH